MGVQYGLRYTNMGDSIQRVWVNLLTFYNRLNIHFKYHFPIHHILFMRTKMHMGIKSVMVLFLIQIRIVIHLKQEVRQAQQHTSRPPTQQIQQT